MRPVSETQAGAIASAPQVGHHLDTPTGWPTRNRKPYLQWVASVLVLLAILWMFDAFARGNINWRSVPEYFVSSIMLDGVFGTLLLTILAMAIGVVGGTVVAIMRRSSNALLNAIAVGYIWLFRGIPALMLLLICFNISLVFRVVSIPFVYTGSTNTLITPMVAAVLGLGLSEVAYVAEIVRGGFLSVPKGQIEAAKSIGMTDGLTMRRIILPQALTIIAPPIGNEFVSMLKFTSLAYVVGYPDLMSQAAKIYTSNYRPMEVLMAATAWYLILTSALTVIQVQIERRISQSPAARRIVDNAKEVAI